MAKSKWTDIFYRYQKLFITFAFLILTIILSLIVIPLSQQIETDRREAAVAPAVEQNNFRLNIQDFQFEDYTTTFSEAGIYYKRPVLQQWSREQVKNYWVPVDQIILGIVEEEHQEEITEIFAKID